MNDVPCDPQILSKKVQQQLLYLARQTIADHLYFMSSARFVRVDASAEIKAGVFVTIRHRGELRGCIGLPESTEVLPITVAEMALAAATRDPRFEPIQADELAFSTIEISVLTPLQKISTLEEIIVGQHGIYIREENHHGLLLPQVATNAGWGREQFLAAVCRKAGLPTGAWKSEKLNIHIFRAEVFSDDEFAGE